MKRQTMTQYINGNYNVRSRANSGPNVACDECGEMYHAYIIPGRSEYKCNDCK